MDTTAPVIVTAPQFLDLDHGNPVTGQTDRSQLSVGWKFEDPEAPYLLHTLHVSGQSQGRHGTEAVDVFTEEEHTLQLEPGDLLMDGDVYTASLTACNPAGLCTTATSQPLLVDSTPPVVGKFVSPMIWKTTATTVTTTASTTTTTNSSTATVNGTVTTQILTTIAAAWEAFGDEESGVADYHLTVGRTFSGDELSPGTLYTAHSNHTQTQELAVTVDGELLPGQLLVFSVWAENTLGLLSPVQRMTFEVMLSSSPQEGTLVLQRHSCTSSLCTNECTCAPARRTCHPATSTACLDLSSDISWLHVDLVPRLACPLCQDKNYTVSATCLQGSWSLPSGNFNITRVQWSFSLASHPAGTGVFDPLLEPLWYDAGPTTWTRYCLPDQRLLSAGSDYVLHVRVWLSESTHVTRTSLPVTVDHSPPARRRGKSVKKTVDAGCGQDVNIVSQQPTLTACWDGVFTDAQSGILSYDVWVGTAAFRKSFIVWLLFCIYHCVSIVTIGCMVCCCCCCCHDYHYCHRRHHHNHHHCFCYGYYRHRRRLCCCNFCSLYLFV